MIYVALFSALATVFALRVIGQIDRAVLIWPVSGVAIALALPSWHLGWAKRFALVCSAMVGFVVAALLIGMPFGLAVTITVLTGVDVLIGATVLAPAVRCFDDLKRQSSIFRFVVVAVAAPILTGSLGAYPLSVYLKLPLVQTAMMNVFGNSLGIAIVLPTILLIRSYFLKDTRKMSGDAVQIAASSALFLSVLSFVFWQTTNPFLFMVFPPMILVLLTMGLDGAVFASIVVTSVAYFATLHGHGPINLMRAATPTEHLLTLQAFCWICMVTALPVGALLDERRRADHKVKEAQSVYQELLHHAEDVIVLSSMDGSHRYVSPAITRLTGWTPEEYVKLDRFETVHPDDLLTAKRVVESLSARNPEYTFRYRMTEKSGGWTWVETTVRAYGIAGEKIAGYVGTVRDISGLKEIEEKWTEERQELMREKMQMATAANTDPLTALLNRRGLDERLRVRERPSDISYSVLMIDIDHFKLYNDRYGHQAGDQCLVHVANLLRSQVGRSGDLIARMGGEEFAVFLAGTNIVEAQHIGQRISRALTIHAVEHESSPFGRVTLSIGAATQSEPGQLDMDRLLAQADKALYQSKKTRNCVSGYTDKGTILSFQN